MNTNAPATVLHRVVNVSRNIVFISLAAVVVGFLVYVIVSLIAVAVVTSHIRSAY